MRALFLTLLLLPFVSKAQDTFYSKAKAHYDKEQFREALYYFKKSIAQEPDKAELYKFQGNCYFALNQLDSAEFSYRKTLSLSMDFPEVYYNLSGIYLEREKPDQAKKYLTTFLKAQPTDADGLLRMSYIVRLEQKEDSSFYYVQRAYKADSLSIRTIMSLITELFH